MTSEGWQAGRQAGTGWEVPAALRIPSCWALFGDYLLNFKCWEGGGILGGELGRFSCAKCEKLGKFSACLLFCAWSNTHRCDEQKEM